MGLQQAGKTAIKDVVFFDKRPGEVEDYMATVHYERQYLDEEKSSLVIDSGGQENYWNEAVTHFRHLVFSNVKILFWIIDMTRPDLFEESERRFSFTIRQFKKENPDGRIIVLCHKVDLISPEELVPLLNHIADSFDEPKYDIRFEPSSIYYGDSLKELVFTVMKEAKMNTKRFELITNIGEKIEASEEFQSYKMENEEDPRIAQLMDFLNPKSHTALPTFGKMTIDFDLSEYDIVEIVLIDRETFSPVVGTSSSGGVSIEKSMDYIAALQEFKEMIKEKKDEENQSKASIVTSSNNKVNAMIFNLESNILLITSFSAITEDKTRLFYELIKKFAKSTEGITPTAPEAAPVENVVLSAKIDVKETKTAVKTEPKTKKPVKPVEAKVEEVIEEEEETVSRFTFLNKLKDELKSAPSEPIVPPVVEPEESSIKAPEAILPPVVDTETKVDTEISEEKSIPEIEESIEAPTVIEESKDIIEEKVIEKEIKEVETKPEITEQITEEPIDVTAKIEEEPIVKEEKIELEQPKAEEITEDITEPIVDVKEKEVKEEIPEAQEEVKKPKRKGFMDRLKEERRRYNVRQIELLASDLEDDSDEKITLSKSDVKRLVEFLAQEKATKENNNE